MIQDLMNNIESEIGILREINAYQEKLISSSGSERKLLETTIISLQNQLKILNKAVPDLLDQISGVTKLPKKTNPEFDRIEVERNNKIIKFVIPAKEKEAFLKEIANTGRSIDKITKQSKIKIEVDKPYKKANAYVSFANKLFFSASKKLAGTQQGIEFRRDLRKSNAGMLLESYISMTFLSTLISLFVGIFAGAGLFFISANLIWSIVLCIAIPVITFISLISYPKLEQNSIERKIEQELPFAVIHMSAISGAGIEPSALFKIIALSKEYPFLSQEIRKVLNQINLYGYDLVTSLTNAARNSPSQKLSELYTGLSTTITQGGDLSNFFEKRSESLLNGYRLEREKFTKVAETFMDIYITVVIAAPMILLLIFILLSVGDFNVGISPANLAVIIIGIVTVVNIIFLLILHIKQPSY